MSSLLTWQSFFSVILVVFKMKKILFLAFTILLGSCQKDVREELSLHDITIIYMIADNDLSSFAIKDINELEQGYVDNGKDKVLIYVDTNVSAHLPSHPVLLELVADQTNTIKSKIIYSYPEQNSASGQVFSSVLKDVLSLYNGSNKLKGLVLWSHGNAWLPENYHIPTDGRAKSFGKDFFPQEATMEISTLATALHPFHFNYILFDACFMASVEVLYELRHSADFFIVSPTEILADGFPYHQIMPYLLGTPQLEKVTQTYYDFYNNQSGVYQSATITLVNTAYLETLSFYCKKMSVSQNTTLQLNDLQQYSRNDERLLFDLKQLLLQNENYNTELEQLWQKLCPIELHTKHIANMPLNNCNGLSVFLFNQNQSLNEYYKQLSWYKHTELASYYIY